MTFASSAPALSTSTWEEQLEPGGATRYFDRRFGANAVKLLPGEYFATRDDLMLVTVLGSCVSACLHDPETGAGGMNHFMLPESELGVATVSARYGSFAMEVLINQLMKLGAARHRLQAKVFGGGSVLRPASSLNVAVRNVDFVRSYLAAEGVPIAAEDLGGDFTRVIHYFPRSGRALIKRLRSGVLGRDIAAERAYSARLVREPVDGNIELFD